jgi:Na+-translocating ferredoxin:NAD+ oxidoreductase RnfD subunit
MALEWNEPRRALSNAAALLMVSASVGWRTHTIVTPILTIVAALLVVYANTDAWKHSIRLMVVLSLVALCLGAPIFHYSQTWFFSTFALFAVLFSLTMHRTSSRSFSR